MKTTTIRIPEDLDKELVEYASKKDISKNQAVKKAIRNLVKSEKEESQNETTTNNP